MSIQIRNTPSQTGLFKIQWNPSNADTMRTTLCVRNIEVFEILLVGVAMHAHAIEHHDGAFQSSLLLYDGKKG